MLVARDLWILNPTGTPIFTSKLNAYLPGALGRAPHESTKSVVAAFVVAYLGVAILQESYRLAFHDEQ